MSTLNQRRSATPRVAKSVSDILVRRSKRKAKAAPMLTEDVAPAGRYRSEIIGVADAKNDGGKLMVDVTYRLTNDRDEAVDARIRYPAEGYHIERLFDALIEAGLPEESPVTDAVGVVEEVEVVYPFEGSLGKIKDRKPATTANRPPIKKAKRTVFVEEDDESDDPESEDDEFDVFLEEDLEEDDV